MKKKIIIVLITTIVLVQLSSFGLNKYKYYDIVPHLKGQIFFLKRDKQILNLYTADASLENIELLYSNRGKGNNNENIFGYYYDQEQDTVIFQAMKDNQRSIFSMNIEEKENYLIQNEAELDHKALRKLNAPVSRDLVIEHDKMKILSEKGTMYLIQEEEEIVLKKFRGIYDWKFNRGYEPITISPDGRYLFYYYSGHLTPLGSMITGFFKQVLGMNGERFVYVMDLKTRKSSKYLRGLRNIEWVKNKDDS